MRLQSRGGEPTAEEVVQRRLVPTTNPDTGKPFDLKLIRRVFSTDCYDHAPENPWRYQTKSKKDFLPDGVMEHRVGMCRWLLLLPLFTASLVLQQCRVDRPLLVHHPWLLQAVLEDEATPER